jgi:two-component system phosphate regulon sensor histidine kinase PhoR
MNVDRARAKRLATQLRDLRAVACELPDALVLMDGEGRVHWSNPAAEALLGIEWPRDRGVVVAERLAHGEVGQWFKQHSEDPGEDVASPTDPAVRLQMALIPFGDHQQLLRARDVSHMTRLELVRRDFVANVSHELRTPLTVIHGYLELMDPEDVPALAPVLKEMRAQSQRMRQIVEDLLALSRLEMQHKLPEERVEMAPLLDTLRREAEALSQGRHRITLEDEAHVDLLGSLKDLHSAFSNLVSNAVRYTTEGGSIRIRWRLVPEGGEYSVIDTGYGISEEHLSRLTERFYRVSSSRSRGTGGTGLGLSIVKHVVNLHEAHMRIESEPGKGSTFACVFEAARLLPVGIGEDE